MPIKRTALKLARKLVCMDTQEQEDAGPIAIQPRLEPDEAQAVEPGRPHQAFVEGEVRKYWQEIKERGPNLTKQSQEELRAAAMPVLCLALRNRRGSRRHQAVAGMVQNALERDWMVRSICEGSQFISRKLKQEPDWIKRPFSEAHESPSYIDALIQLADDAMWLAKEITLPDHPPPYHPPIYYTIRIEWDYPGEIPREDAVIRGDYVYENRESRSRVIKDGDFYPVTVDSQSYWRYHKMLDGEERAEYTVDFQFGKGPENRELADITLQWVEDRGSGALIRHEESISKFHFSPPPRGK